MLWLGLTEGTAQLSTLHAALERALAAAGWHPEERPFRVHLTLARSDGVRAGPRTARLLIEAARNLTIGWVADRVTLFESHTGGGPARYESLVEARLGR